MDDTRSDEERARGAWLTILRPALEQLAWSGQEQIAWLDRNRISEDEVALDFEDAFLLRWMWRDQGWLTTEVDELLVSIDALLADMSGPQPERWSDEAIVSGGEWQQLRDWAGACLAVLPDIE